MRRPLVLSLFLLVLIICFAKLGPKRPASAAAVPPRGEFDRAITRLADLARASGTARVIVGLDVAARPEGSLSRGETELQRQSIKRGQRDLIDRLRLAEGPALKRFDYIPYLAFEATAEQLELLRTDARVLSIEEDIVGEAALAESTAIVGAPAAWSSGYTGSGQTVAILDSGVDRNHTFLAGKVISEACYSSNVAGQSTTVCPGGATESTAQDSGLHCPVSVSGCAHGTNVAGIAAGKGTSFSGVAKDANIIAIQMFSRFDNATTCGSSTPCARYWTSDLLRALERVRTLSMTMPNIAAVNLSLQTGQQFTSNCDVAHAPTKAAIDNLRSVGIATIICAGNYSFTNALTAPACISTSISVGSVDDGSLGTTANVVSSFSDSSSLLHLLAPGRWINSSVPNNLFENYSGTSMATPHVVGAFAVLRQRRPAASQDQILQALTATGQPITDSRNGVVKPRIRVDLALQMLASSTLFDYDGDGRADLSVRRLTDNVWHLLRATAGYTAMQWGETGDKMAPADYDGDGKTDVAVFRPSNGTWYVIMSQTGTFQAFGWGQNGDVPVPTDKDNDGNADLVVYRESNNTWYTRFSNGTFNQFVFGEAGDKPMLGDFDGDGKGDIAVFRPSNNNWYIIKSSLGFFIQTWGEAGDIPTTGDFDGDGKTDQAVFRPSTGQWFLSRTTAGFASQNWGQAGDIPVAADYDGDGKTDMAVFRPSNSNWYIIQSTNGILIQQFGVTGDVPTPAAFLF